jgi:uncharacterized protein
MGFIQRRLLKAVLAVVQFPRATLLICAALLAVSVGAALTRLTINTDEDRLFSSHVGFFRNYLDYIAKFPENEAVYVMVQPADPQHPPPLERWTAIAETIAGRMRAMTKLVSSVEYRTPVNELGSDALLFSDRQTLLQSFQDAQTELAPLIQVWGGRPNMLLSSLAASPMQQFIVGMSLVDPDAQKAQFAQLLADSWTSAIQTGRAQPPDLVALRAQTPTDLGYSYVSDQTDPMNHLLLIGVYLNDADSSLDAGGQQVDAVHKAADEAAADFPDFRIGITGRPVLADDEMRTSDRDSTRAEILALIVIFAGLVLFLRSFWMAAVAEISLAVAIGWTFGWTTISVGELNLLSLVFLITLIGIGMDYLVQILTRYRREMVLYERPAAIWARVFRHVSPPICTACLGAAGAFFVSIFTNFTGAAELGIIAGGGLLLCLASGYTVLPALLVIFPPHAGPVQTAKRYAEPKPRSAISRLVLPACWVLALALIVPFSNRTTFNPNLLDMQAQNLDSVQLVRKLQTWSAVVMTPDLPMLRRVHDAVAASPLVASLDSVVDAQNNYAWLKTHQGELPKIDWTDPAPVDAANLPGMAAAANSLADKMAGAKFDAAAASLRRFAAALKGSAAGPLTQWQNLFVDQLKRLWSQFFPAPLEINKLPDELRNHLVSADGYYALYITPTQNLWKRELLVSFMADVEARVNQIPGHPAVTGIASDIYHSTSAIESAFFWSTVYALSLVLVLVFVDLRSVRQTLLTVSVLGLGLPMLVGLMGLLHIDWNFANFFGLPILIGAGHEYGVFMTHRYREVKNDPRRVWGSWDTSDRALLLCAFVTTSSFAFFWALGHHEGLKSLGLVMALGTACIYLAAILVVRPLLKWRIERAGHWMGKSGTKNAPELPSTASAAK